MTLLLALTFFVTSAFGWVALLLALRRRRRRRFRSIESHPSCDSEQRDAVAEFLAATGRVMHE